MDALAHRPHARASRPIRHAVARVLWSAGSFLALAPFSLLWTAALLVSVVAFNFPYVNDSTSLLWSVGSIIVGTTILDLVVGQQVVRGQLPAVGKHFYLGLSAVFPLVAVLTIPVGVLGACVAVSGASDASLLSVLAFAALVGILNGAVTLTAAHDLIHRRSRTLQGVGALATVFCAYPCFVRQHVFVHHPWVGTSQDPSTARIGESLYQFIPRTVGGSWCGAFRVERELPRDGSVAFAGWLTPVLMLALILVILSLGVVVGRSAAAFFLLQAAFAVLTLETINYIQHYGLTRRVGARGIVEVVSHHHAFSAPFLFSNLSFLNLLLHADHHVYPRRPYPLLRLPAGAPVFPLPAFLMFVIAFVPPLWFAWMDPRAREANIR